MSEPNPTIRGFRILPVRCPKHGNIYVWTAITDQAPSEREVAKYDCGCIVSVDATTIGATIEWEHVAAPAPEPAP
jgi:hypothetical protein